MPTDVPFDRVHHLTRVTVDVPDGSARFLVDTGIGMTLLGSALRERLGLALTGEQFTGRRMSGQEITAPLVGAPDLTVGGFRLPARPVAVDDFGSVDGPDGFDGILGLDLLGELPLTIDPVGRRLLLGATPTANALGVPAHVERDGRSVAMYVDLTLPSGRTLAAEVDTGSDHTILADRFMADCGVGPNAATRTAEGADETGHQYVRRWIQVPGALAVSGRPETTHDHPTVMFQDIELDALIGTDFLDRWVQTYDTRGGTLHLSAPGT